MGRGKRRRRRLWPLLALLLFLVGFVWAGLPGYRASFQDAAARFQFADVFHTQFFYGGDGAAMIAPSLPLLSDREGGASLLQWDVALRDEVTGPVPVFVRVARTATGETRGSVAALAARPRPNLALKPLSGDTVRVLIYSTHNSEGYADGDTTVLTVGARLAKTLREEYGIGAVADNTVHDADWAMCYAASRQTAQKLLAQYPEAELLIDLHRDSGPAKGDVTLSTAEGSAAKLLLVVGSNLKYEHPDWEQNYATAEALSAAAEAVWPGLVRGVRVQAGRYNQQLTPKAVLAEVGADVNLSAEALRSAELLAAAIDEYLRQAEK